MGIKRKVRQTGESLAVTIPSQIAQLHDIKEGDYLAVSYTHLTLPTKRIV